MGHQEGWGAAPYWTVKYRAGFLGGQWYAVNLNGHTDVARFDDRAKAELDAARRNYEAGSYPLPSQFGL